MWSVLWSELFDKGEPRNIDVRLLSDHGFKGTYALPTDSTLEDSVKSAGALTNNLSDEKLDILMGMFVKFQDSVELQQSKTTHEMAEIKIELGSIRSPASFSNMIKQRFRIANLTTDEHQCSLVRLCQTIRIKALIMLDRKSVV